MPEKENNHYVPRLILRKFDEKISTYNLEKRELKLNQKLEKVFVSKKLYSKEIETMFNEKVENEFAKLLNNKILNSINECKLSRIEINLIKKFILLAMIRTINFKCFLQYKIKEIRKEVKIKYNFEESTNLKSLSVFDYLMQTIKCILEAESIFDLEKTKEATAISIYWANIFSMDILQFEIVNYLMKNS